MSTAPSIDPAPQHRDGLVMLALAGLVAATVLASALLPSAAPKSVLAPANDPACAEWTDGCRVCQRGEGGASCSLPGIACTKTAPECLSQR